MSADEYLGLTRECWERYQGQLRNLGLAGGIDPGSALNEDSYKGYLYAHFATALSAVKSGQLSDI